MELSWLMLLIVLAGAFLISVATIGTIFMFFVLKAWKDV